MKRSLGIFLALISFVLMPLSTVAKNNHTGGGSDGGGNSYRGKPLESYAKDPAALAAFQKLIVPTLQDLKSKETSTNSLRILRNLISSVFAQKIWYFVPGPLEHIPTDLLNSAVRTDQAALQGFDRVWIDEDIWNKMSVDDQSKLLLHEAYMGLKIYQFASPFRLCKAAWGASYDCAGKEIEDTSIHLTARDYTDVQNMTIQTMSNYAAMTNDEWMALIRQSNLKFEYDWFEKYVDITPSDLSKLIVQSTVSGFLPTQGYNMRDFDSDTRPPLESQNDLYNYLQKNKESCQIQAKVSGSALHLKLSSKTESFDQVISLPQKIQSRYDEIFHEKRDLQRIGLSHLSQQERPDGGYTFYNIWLGFDFYRLAQVYIQEMVCTDKDCSSPYIDVKGGMHYICSDNGYLFKP